MKIKNALKLNVEINDNNITTDAAPGELVESGKATIEIEFDGHSTGKDFKIYMAPEFFTECEEPGAESEESVKIVPEDYYVRIHKEVNNNRLDTIVTIETDIDRLLDESVPKFTVSSIEPACEEHYETEESGRR